MKYPELEKIEYFIKDYQSNKATVEVVAYDDKTYEVVVSINHKDSDSGLQFTVVSQIKYLDAIKTMDEVYGYLKRKHDIRVSRHVYA